jgi:hypothetical protein
MDSLWLRPTLLQSLHLLPILFLNTYGIMQCSWIIIGGNLTWCLILLSDCFAWWHVVWQSLQWVWVHTYSSVYCSWHCAFTHSVKRRCYKQLPLACRHASHLTSTLCNVCWSAVCETESILNAYFRCSDYYYTLILEHASQIRNAWV